MKICIVVPHYDHFEQFRKFLPNLKAAGLPLVVVDDASPPETVTALAELLVDDELDIRLARHDDNLGKGGAVTTGLRVAADAGFTHALQMDADGQHSCDDISTFLDASRSHPDSIICGRPEFDESIPRFRYYARYITLFLSWLETLSTEIEDAMCGFRLYPLAATTKILNGVHMGERMAFDPELLVRAVWSGIPLHYVPVTVVYPEGGQSHFYYFRDNLEISWMHTRLLFGMLWRLPRLVVRKNARP